MRIHERLIATIRVGLILGATATVVAQTPESLTRIDVSIWPEYDRPSALVMVNAHLPDESSLPTTVSLPMPSQATLHAVAKRAPDGRLLLASYTLEEHEEWSDVRISTDLRIVRLEYYTELSLVGEERELIWVWPGGWDVGMITYEILPPPDASNLVIDPPAVAQRVDPAGLTHLAAELGPRSASDRVALRLTYTKPTPELTVTMVQSRQSSPSADPAATTEGSPAPPEDSNWVFALPVLAVGLIVAWIAFRRMRGQQRGC